MGNGGILLKQQFHGWREESAASNTGISSRGPSLVPSISGQFTTTSNSSSGYPMLFSYICRHQAHTWYTDIHEGVTPIHINKSKINLFCFVLFFNPEVYHMLWEPMVDLKADLFCAVSYFGDNRFPNVLVHVRNFFSDYKKERKA